MIEKEIQTPLSSLTQWGKIIDDGITHLLRKGVSKNVKLQGKRKSYTR